MNANEKARLRVSKSPALRKHESTIFYDWPEGDAHLKWIASFGDGQTDDM